MIRLVVGGGIEYLPPTTMEMWQQPILLLLGAQIAVSNASAESDLFQESVQPLLNRYCLECHGGKKTKADVDFTRFQNRGEIDAAFQLWESVNERLQDGDMPPDDAPQPTADEKRTIHSWYQQRFVEDVQAHPGYYHPRRLSAVEYRNTLRSLLGFDLEVNIIEAEQTVAETSLVLKLLPTDPPGASGFTNDTYSNPLTTLIWSQYSYLVDVALEQLFLPAQRPALEELAGPLESSELNVDGALRLMDSFMERVYRRPTDWNRDDLVLRLQSASEEERLSIVHTEMKGALMSPRFLYRGILMPKEQGKQQRVDAYELAERLSYFLWGDMPDQTLFALAESEALYESDVLQQEVDRMLESDKSRHLVDDLVGQWLALGDMEQASKQVPFQVALRTQVTEFVYYLIQEQRPLMELIDSEVAFVNPLVARFYGKDREQLGRYRRPKGIEMRIEPHRRIQLEHATYRGGVLRMPGILAMNRGPVLRGVWMLERILGEHLPEPPMDVGQVAANVPGENLSFRERFEAHRSEATCAVCHDKIDPLGFATQGYDDRGNYIVVSQESTGSGGIRYRDQKENLIDLSGQMPNGEQFASMDELLGILKNSYREPIIRNIVERFLSFALCRKLEYFDRPTVDHIVETVNSRNGSYRDLIGLIVESLPFQQTFAKKERS